ncbi:High mobility group B protein 6 [Citrus sinensis]|nr:High mobility group B protein 6 [Citrus sinensis]
MASSDVASMAVEPSKKPRSRRALKPKNSLANEAVVMAQTPSQSPIPNPPDAGLSKENHESLSQPKKAAAKGKAKQATKKQDTSFDKDLQEMQEMLEKMKLEKEKTEELLKEKDEMLKMKEEELELQGKEQEKLHMELKKLQKMKEFKPNMTLPIVQCLKDKEQDRKKKGCAERKRPSPPYILWCKDQWNEVKKENPEAEFKEITNILGAKWKNVSAEEKKPYEEKYQAEKEAYLQVMAKERRESEAMKLLEEEHKQKTAMELLEQYLQFKQEADKENKKPKKEKDPLKPKHPVTAYFLFSSERRAALLADNKNVLEVAKITGEEWKNMTEEQKRPYEEKNKEKRQKKKQQEIDPNRPKKPASSFLLFSKEARKILLEERPGTNNSTINALISVKWKELGEEEKQDWNAKAAEAMEAYKKALEEYNKSVAS